MPISERLLGLSLAVVLGGCRAPPLTRDGEGPRPVLDAGPVPDGAPIATSHDAAARDARSEPPPAALDPEPICSTEERAALDALHYDDGPPPADPSNRVADDRTARTWGQRLFFDPGFSGPLLEGDNDGSVATLGVKGVAGRVSCAGCHVPGTGFVDTRSPHRQISLAAEWSQRRTPSLLEVAFAPLYNWDGRRDAIWNQAVGVMESRREFNSSRLFVAEEIFRRYRGEYEALFGAMPPLDDRARFPALAPEETGCAVDRPPSEPCRGVPGDGAEYDGMAAEDQQAVTRVTAGAAKAIGAYVRELRCGSSRFDAWLDGDPDALTRSEQRGAALFVGRGRCASCHTGPRLTDGKFHNVGLAPRLVAVAFTDTNDHGALDGLEAALTDPLSTAGIFSDGDRGKLPSSVAPTLDGAFRTPGLRCIAKHPSFLHTAQLGTLEAVVRFFSNGGDAAGYPGMNELERVNLSEREQADLVAFLAALEGPGPDAALLTAPP